MHQNLGKYGPKKFYHIPEDTMSRVTKRAAMDYSTKSAVAAKTNAHAFMKQKRKLDTTGRYKVNEKTDPGPGAYNVPQNFS